MTTDSENLSPENPDQVDDTIPDEARQPTFDEAAGEEQEFKPGDALGHPQAGALCADREATVIVVAGGHRSGKTSLLTSIYEHLNQQLIAEWGFERSSTLFGFERRCHGAREESGLHVPNIQRSSQLQPPWLHLDLRSSVTRERRRILFADISGEWFEGLIDGTRDIDELPHIWRADQMSVVLDGHKLADSSEAPVERARVETLLRHFREQEALVSPVVLSLVVTKLDELLSRDPDAVERLDEIARGASAGAGYPTQLPVFRTAARPKTPELPAGHGVVALFSAWLDAPRFMLTHSPPLPNAETAFAQFQPELANG